MTDEFVTYNQALALRELGFDEPCFGYYEPNGNFGYTESHIIKDMPYLAKNSEWQDLSAPLYSQAFRWFREKGIYFEIVTINVNKQYEISILNDLITGFKTYEEAEQACLDKLIELVKNGNTSN